MQILEMMIAHQQFELRAGPLAMLFERGGLRYVRLGNREVLRRVYVGVRDRNWGTLEPEISNLKSEVQPDSFRVEFDCQHRRNEIDFHWRGVINGAATGEVVFTMEGEAHSDFLRNRIGFCVLHPIDECAGQPCELLHTEGTVEQSRFPSHIAPHQPFLDLQALTHEVLPGVRATVRFEGDTFETEDQRNWTDWSFKTYSTPLALPFPVQMNKGEHISQRISLQLMGAPTPEPQRDGASLVSTQSREVKLIVGEEPIQKLPQIGLGMASHGQSLTTREIALLRALRLSHLRADLHLSRPEFEQTLERAVAESNALDVALEAALFLSDASGMELERLIAALNRFRPRVARWLVFHEIAKVPDAQLVARASEALRNYNAHAVIGTGANLWFTEINRHHPPLEEVDLVCYAISPQTHAADDLTLMENLVGQAATVQNAKELFGSLPVVVSPITLKPRFSASAASPDTPPLPGQLPPQVDPRQSTLQAAAWTLGSLKYLAESGAAGVTYFETTGWRGVMELETGSLLPDQIPSAPGAIFPLWRVLADVGEFAGGDVLPVQSLEPLKVAGLAISRSGQMRVMLANLTAEAQVAQLDLPSERVLMKRLNEENLPAATLSPEEFRARSAEEMLTKEGLLTVTLFPHEIVALDVTKK